MNVKWYFIISFWEGYYDPYGEIYYIIAIPQSQESLNRFVYNNDYSEMEIFIIPQDPTFYMSTRHKMRETNNNQYFMVKGQEVEYPFILDEFINELKYDNAHRRDVLHHIHGLLV